MDKLYPISYIDRLRIGTDGDGIRTLILVGGCPMRCRYCANAFTWNGSRGGKKLSAPELYSAVRKDTLYMLATKGGVTFGGGEPLLYPSLLNEFRDVFDPELTIFAESSLHVPVQNIESAAACVDHFFVDIKTMDARVYRQYTGCELEPAKENLIRLLELKGEDAVTVRIPIIPDYADSASQEWSRQQLEALGVRHFDLFTYKKIQT